MDRKKSVAPDSQDDATEADLCSVAEGDQTVPSSDFESGVSEDAIRTAAYALYETRNGIDGSAEDDWLQAEARLMQIGGPGV